MGKGPKRQRRNAATKSKSKKREEDTFWEDDDSEDEIDAFHKQRDVIPLDVNEDESEDEYLEQPVFDFEDASANDSDDNDDVDDDDDHDDDHDDNNAPRKSLEAKIARQAKFLKQKFGGVNDEMDDDEDENEEEDEENKSLWGSGKRRYYDGENADFEIQSSDEELPKEEEEEVLRIQREKAKLLSMKDFGLQDSDQDESDSDKQDNTSKDELHGGKTTKKDKRNVVVASLFDSYEVIKKDLSALSKEEQMDIVFSSAPELVGLLSELNEALDQLEDVEPDVSQVKALKHVNKSGMHQLEVKQALLLTYCQAISFYLLLKAEGLSVRDHPVIARLVEIKNMLEKMKQIEGTLSCQIDDTTDHANVAGVCETKAGEVTNKQERKRKSAAQDEANLVSQATKARKEYPLKETKHEITKQMDKEVEISLRSSEMLKIRANLEAKLKEKGLLNLPKPKSEDFPNLKPAYRKFETRDDFNDEVQENANGSIKSKLPQLVINKSKKAKLTSGDDDLPKRDNIGERRRKHELCVLSRFGANSPDDVADDYDMADGNVAQDESEDEFYKEVKRKRIEKRQAKEKLNSLKQIIPSFGGEEEEADSKRDITYQMATNRGLTRPRKKLLKNPRKKYRIKHAKLVSRWKGQVRDIKKPFGPYGGELTGINPNVSRSTRFKS